MMKSLSNLPQIGVALAIIGTFGVSLPAHAAEFTSAYTDLDLDRCTVVSVDDLGSAHMCKGCGSIPVYVSEGDLRFSIAYGLLDGGKAARGQSLGPFNTLGPRIEWRLANASGRLTPFATIVRYFVAQEDGTGPDNQVLVVTKLDGDNSCHSAYIDALANPNANQLARDAADSAKTFDCATDEVRFVGKFEAWTRL